MIKKKIQSKANKAATMAKAKADEDRFNKLQDSIIKSISKILKDDYPVVCISLIHKDFQNKPMSFFKGNPINTAKLSAHVARKWKNEIMRDLEV